jgi:hypothetical protein
MFISFDKIFLCMVAHPFRQLNTLDALVGKVIIYDRVRKKRVMLTPEEQTRQHLLHYLVHVLGYPSSLIQVEQTIVGYPRINRVDLIVYNNDGKPFLVAECKAAHVPLSLTIYNQVMRYNSRLKAPFVVITNGACYGCWKLEEERMKQLEAIPAFERML